MKSSTETITIMPAEMQESFVNILRRLEFSEDKAVQCASIFTANSVDGVYTHGVSGMGS
jgi:3-dehydro-L-gulonate 2-dehydrogenase